MVTMILDWLAAEFNIAQSSIQLTALAGDASARRYYRCVLSNTRKYIVMQAARPLPNEFFNFINLARQMQSCGIQVPEIYKINQQLGCLLLSDFGDDLYLTVLQNNLLANEQLYSADQLYSAAFAALSAIQKIDPQQLPVMNANYIADRLMVFKTWFLQQHLQLEIDADIERVLADTQDLMLEVYADQPQVFVHLDYHSRNLLVLPNDNHKLPGVGVIDFQDAMLGPITYDLVSLLQDAYITWPRAQVERWVADYQQRAYAQGLLPRLDLPKFLRLFDLVGVHRHLKNLGVFARLYHRDGKAQYLPHMPTLIQYILAACQRYPRLAPLEKLVTSGEFIVQKFYRGIV